MAACGFFFGIIQPSRDMMVRAVTPPGSFGKVFGFVTTGFNLGGMVSPLIFGASWTTAARGWCFCLSQALARWQLSLWRHGRAARPERDQASFCKSRICSASSSACID